MRFFAAARALATRAVLVPPEDVVAVEGGAQGDGGEEVFGEVRGEGLEFG